MSTRPSVLVTRRLPASVIQRLEAACDVDLCRDEGGLSHDELVRRVHGKQGLICLLTDRVDQAVIDAGRDLRVVSAVAVGYDNVDVAAARARHIVVTNTPDVLTEAVAEFTWALILAVTRRVAEGDRLIRRGQWAGWAFDFMLGAQLSGRRLGIVGAGRIGRAVARRAPAFGMQVSFASSPGRAPSPLPEGDSLSLDELLVASDVVSLHVPFNDRTRHLVDQRALARMKRSAYLVNTSRGAVVDEAALIWALGEGLIAGAALDVFEREPSVPDELRSRENVVLAPHLGSATRETRTAMADLAARNVLAVLAGEPPLTPVAP